MKRTTPFTTALLTLLAAAAWSTACGGDDERPRIEKSRLGPVQPVAERSEERTEAEYKRAEELVHDLFVWPEGAGEPRSVRADYRDCYSQLDEKTDVRSAHPLIRIKWLQDCMTSKGWAFNPDAGIPES